MSGAEVLRVELATGPLDASGLDELAGRIWADVTGVLAVGEPNTSDDPVTVWLVPEALDTLRAVVGDDVAFTAVLEAPTPVDLVTERVPIPGLDEPVEVVLDAQHVFGRGDHPTSRLAVAALADIVRPGDEVLDVGCGSGVLAIVAARLGAARVVAVDLDAAAVACAVENAARSEVAATVDVRLGSLPTAVGSDERFDVVVANLSTATIVELAARLSSLARPGGLVLTGVLRGQEDLVQAAMPAAAVVAADGDWVLLRA